MKYSSMEQREGESLSDREIFSKERSEQKVAAQTAAGREMTCICCPLGCGLTVTMEEDGSVSVSGNTCPRGAEYGKKELLCPARTVTSTVRIAGRKNAVVSVKTAADIPKERIMECMKALAGVEIEPPIKIGDVVLADAAGTGVDVIATRNVE